MSFVYIVYGCVIACVFAVALVSTMICVAARKLLLGELRVKIGVLVQRYVDGETGGTWREWMAEFLIKHNLLGAKGMCDGYIEMLDRTHEPEQVSPKEEYDVAQCLRAALSDSDDPCVKLGVIFNSWTERNRITIECDFIPDEHSKADAELIHELCDLIGFEDGWDALLDVLAASGPSSFMRGIVIEALDRSQLRDWPSNGPNPLEVLDLFQELLERIRDRES